MSQFSFRQRQQQLLARPPQGTQHIRAGTARERRASGRGMRTADVYDREQLDRNRDGNISIRHIGSQQTAMELPVPGSAVTGKPPTAVEDNGSHGYSMAATEAVSWTVRRSTAMNDSSNLQLSLLLWPVGGDLNSSTFTIDIWWRQSGQTQSATPDQSTTIKSPLITQGVAGTETIQITAPDLSYTHLTVRVTCDAVSAPAAGEPGLFAAELTYTDHNIHRHRS
jgi:hypothetical protein